jgi:hypothetical protein
LDREQRSETEGVDSVDDEYRLRSLGWLNNFVLLPASGIIAFFAVILTDLPRLLMLPALWLIYGVVAMSTLVVHDRVARPASVKGVSDYLLLGLGILKDSVWLLFAAAVGGVLSLLSSS